MGVLLGNALALPLDDGALHVQPGEQLRSLVGVVGRAYARRSHGWGGYWPGLSRRAAISCGWRRAALRRGAWRAFFGGRDRGGALRARLGAGHGAGLGAGLGTKLRPWWG